MPAPMTPHTFFEREVVDKNGEKVGQVEDLYVDDSTGEPAFLLISGGLFGMRKHFVPVAGATVEGDDIVRVAYDAETVKNAPSVSADDHLEAYEEKALFEYYGMGDQHAGERVMLVSWEIYVA
jgi:sporulation protein YlmC with PRC-barrel domain